VKPLGTDIERNIETDMLGYLPGEYSEYRESVAIIHSEAVELESLNGEIADVLAQFYIDTATWGLANWERVCGLTTDETKPYDQRRSVIKSKLRGVGTVTVDMIKNVAGAYAGGEIDVTEDNAHYTVNVKFVGERGIPANLDDCKNALRDIIPAHLAINYIFTYTTFGELTSYAETFGSLTAKGLTFDTLSRYKE
jgi:hypothetical protein